MKYDNLIVDVNNLFARAFAVAKKDEGQSSQEILHRSVLISTKIVFSLMSRYCQNNSTVYLLADNPTSKASMRKKISGGEYKSNRPEKESDGYYRSIDFLLLIFSYYSEQFSILRIKRLEADDLVPEILKSCLGQSLLCSSDLDWARCMNWNVDWYNHKDVYTQESFKAKFKYTPNEKSVTLMKVLMGDISDNIPSISGMNTQTALNIVLNFDDIYEVLSCIKRNTEKAFLLSDYTRKLVMKNEERLLKNHNLVYFCEVSEEEVSQALIKGNFNSNALSILYKSLNFPPNFDSRIEDKKVSFGDIFSNFDEVNRK